MKKIVKMLPFNPEYGLGDKRSKPHIQKSRLREGYILIRPWTYDERITEEQAMKSSLPIYEYEYTF